MLILTLKSKTPLYYAAMGGVYGVFEALKKGNPDMRDLEGRTPLHFAAEVGNIDIVELLIESGAETCVRDNNGKTPYDIARGLVAKLKGVR